MTDTQLTIGESSLCISNRDLYEVFKFVVTLIVGELGVAGNIFIIILAAKYTERKNLHYLIINMSICDILFVLTYFLRDVVLSLLSSPSETFAKYFCKMVVFLENTSELLTLIILLFISIKRFRATKLVSGEQPCSNAALICIAWLVSMIFACYNLAFRSATKSNPSDPFSCITKDKSKVYNALFLVKSACLMFLYFLVFIICVATSLRLSKFYPIHANLSDEQRRRRARKIISAVRMVLCSLLLYSICYLPDFLEDIIKSLNPAVMDGINDNCHEMLNFILHIPKLINTCLNPFVYLVFLADFRKGAATFLSRDTRDAAGPIPDEGTQDTRL